MKRFLSAVWRLLADWVDPVCQNRGAVIFGQYRGHYVRLRPVVGGNGRVKAWTPDPADADRIDRALASGVAPTPTTPASAPALPVSPASPATPPFNPTGVPGL